MITRIMCVGPGRINETFATLSFDFHLTISPDITYIISPYDSTIFQKLFHQFDLDPSKFVVIHDDYFNQYYNLSRWSNDNWYKQQALKLCSLDHFDSEHFLIQDCDLILLQPYSIIENGNLNFKAEPLWNNYHTVYADMVERVTGLKRTQQCSLVNELMPYTKQDWINLKQLIENSHVCGFLDAIPNVRMFDDTKWFSEYELLGIYKTNQTTGWQHFITTSQPPIYTWDDFYSTNWKQQHTIKFHAPPLKFMSTNEAMSVVNFVKKLIDN